jgi:hypothetical protein
VNKLWCVSVCVAALCPAAIAGSGSNSTQSLPLDDAALVEMNVDFGAGYFQLGRAREGQLLEGTFTSDRDDIEAEASYHRRGERGVLDLSIHSDESSISGHIKNEWTVGMAPGVPLDIDLELGAAEADLDLSGLSVSRLRLEVGAADCELWWDRRNPVRLTDLEVECGASSVHLEGLGYADFEHLTFEGGLGSFELDFSGDWLHSATADLEVGMGEMELRVPPGIGVRIETDKALASVKVDRHFVRRGDDVYESENYGDAEIKLDCYVEVGMGSLVVKSSASHSP